MELLEVLLNAKSIAVIGASNKVGRPGYTVVKNILDAGFDGEVYPVNPNEDRILGLRSYRSIAEVPRDSIDIAIIAVSRYRALPLLEECGEKKVKLAIVLTAGFSEAGHRNLEEELVKIAKKYNMRILGPNTAGLVYMPRALVASIETIPLKGSTAFIAQSGALASIFIEDLKRFGQGLSLYIGLGNRADIDEVDSIDIAYNDPYTRSIAMYLEGFKRGRAFLQRALNIVREKPIALILGGRTRAGARAILSHTASLALSYAKAKQVLEQHGICIAETIEELEDLAIALPNLEPDIEKSVCIITNSGGPSILAVDYIEDAGLEVPELEVEVRDELRRILPPIASVGNPIDTTAEIDRDKLINIVDILIRKRVCSYIVFVYVPIAGAPWRELAEALTHITDAYGKRLLVYVGGENSIEMYRELTSKSVAVVKSLKSLASVLRCSYVRAKVLRRARLYHSPS